jgi:hypothetical protein
MLAVCFRREIYLLYLVIIPFSYLKLSHNGFLKYINKQLDASDVHIFHIFMFVFSSRDGEYKFDVNERTADKIVEFLKE